ncbi:MAG: hypothetical protein ABI700_19685 [Chloroflexota bacterium]
MAHYCDVSVAFELKEDAPPEVIDLLKARIGSASDVNLQAELDKRHPLSSVMNSNWTFSLSSMSSLFYDAHMRRYYLTLHFQTKRGEEIEPFLAWIATYSDQVGVVGYKTIPALQETSLICFDAGEAFWIKVEALKRTKMERTDE